MFRRFWQQLVFPGSQYPAPSLEGLPEDATRHDLTTASGERVLLLESVADADELDSPHVLFFYGNGMTLAHCAHVRDLFVGMGCRVWMPDYVGYGWSSGSPSERGCRETALASYRHIVEGVGVSPDRLFLSGWSLGAAVAIDLAAGSPCAGLLASSAFTSLGDVAKRWTFGIPVSNLFEERFDNLSKLPSVECPILLAHGTNDEVVPVSMGRRLAKAAPTSTFVEVAGAGHELFGFGDPGLLHSIEQFVHCHQPTS